MVAADSSLPVGPALPGAPTVPGPATTSDDLAAVARTFQAAPVGMALVGLEGRLLQVNDALADIVGRSRSELLAGGLTSLVAPEGAERSATALLRAWQAEGRSQTELSLQDAAGRVVPCACHTALARDGSGTPSFVVLCVTDRTSERLTEQALRDAEATLRLVLEAAPDGIIVVGGDGRIMSANARVEELFGYRPAEVVGETIEVLVPYRLEDVHRRYRSRYLQDPRSRPMGPGLDLTARRKDGSEFPVEVGLGATEVGARHIITCVITDISERKLAEERLAYHATHDQLTQLPNRTLFADRLKHGLAHAARHGHRPAVLFMDLDRFKVVNDSLGHAVGDEVLRVVGQRLADGMRAEDTAARFGGDEFALLCPDVGTNLSNATRVAERILGILAQPLVLDDREIVLSASIGIAVASAGERDPDRLLRDADAAMYRAKDRGRGRYEIFGEAIRTTALHRLELEHDLRHAIKQHQLRLVYQPLMSLSDNRIVGVEALQRWLHPERGVVSPADFIPVAEDSGLIVSIGAWALHEACRQASRWRAQHADLRTLQLSVNLCPSQLEHPGLVATVRTALEASGLPPSSLLLEITETALGDDTPLVSEQLAELAELGVSLAIDDFGTGHSSLTRLRRFAVESIKIDRSFVAGLGVDHDDSTIVAAVVNLAHALGIVAVAEGVETDLQLKHLRTLGCDLAQGFLLSRPLPPADLAQFVIRRVRNDRKGGG